MEGEEKIAADSEFSWQASEYTHQQKSANWYIGLALAIVALIAIAYLTKQWLSIGVFVAMAGALAVYARKSPQPLIYSLNGSGINIENKFYAFTQFKSFGLVHDANWQAIELEPTQRFMPRFTVLFDDADLDQIISVLENQLPRADHSPDWVDRITRYLKF